jgi:hypothetical protein
MSAVASSQAEQPGGAHERASGVPWQQRGPQTGTIRLTSSATSTRAKPTALSENP